MLPSDTPFLPILRSPALDPRNRAMEQLQRQAEDRRRRGPWIPRRSRTRPALIVDSNGNVRTDDWVASPLMTSIARGELEPVQQPGAEPQTARPRGFFRTTLERI
jgi:hypothetical protein